ncbi:MAG TPA: serine hydrolase [Terriglobales bacterium]|nr:serine hydrolase [Terriglobales bacterium]
MTRLRPLPTTALLCAMSLGPDAAPAQTPALPELDRFVRAVAAAAAPAVFSVAVVRGDSVIHLAGYGARDASGAPVTPRTAFYIASSTKSFTALAAALLAARGVVDLDAPVGRYASEFSLPAPLDASRITLRRLLSHRGGFESEAIADRTAYIGNIGADSLLPLLARTAAPVDTGFTYTNTQFIVAARVLERRTGVPWQELVEREVLRPLGLARTTARMSAAAGWELAHGFGPGPEGHRPVALKPDATMHAAGGMVMSAGDAATWLRAQLGRGRVGGRQLLPAAVVAETHRRVATQSADYDAVRRTGYGLGWQHGVMDGELLLHHFGNYPGAFAHLSFMPERGVGVAVFTNAEMGPFRAAAMMIARRAYDLALARTERDAMYARWPGELSRLVGQQAERARADHRRRAARPAAPPRGWGAYAGTYHARDLGELAIAPTPDGAELRFGAIRSRLEVLSGDTLRAELPPGRGGVPLPVTLGPDGRVRSLTLAGATFERR